MSSIDSSLLSKATAITREIVDEHATEGRDKLKKIIVPDLVVRIDECAFYQCESLEEIILPKSLTEIDEWAFYQCCSLEKIKLPNSIIKINDGAFSTCSSLKEIVLPQSITEIGNFAFGACTLVKHIVLPNSIKKIGEGAFSHCEKLVYAYLLNSIQSIGARAFEYCPFLSVIAVPENTTMDLDSFEEWHSIFEVAENNQMEPETLLQQRFDKLPLHQICYDPQITLESLTNTIEQMNENEYENVDAFSMNALHILCMNPNVTYEMIAKLVTACPSLRSMNCDDEGFSPAMMYYTYIQEYDGIIENKSRLSLDDFLMHRILRQDEIMFLLALDEEMRNELSLLNVKDQYMGLYPFLKIASNESYSLEALFWLLQGKCNSNCFETLISLIVPLGNGHDDEEQDDSEIRADGPINKKKNAR